MYVTRPLSLLRKSPELLNLSPQEGPNSGYLVLYDEDCETKNCFGCKDRLIRSLPFPQNKNLSVYYTTGQVSLEDQVLFIPALDQPLSSNRYYVIQRKGYHIGEANASSKKEDEGTFCGWKRIKDVEPRPFDSSDIYQQFEIIQKKHCYFTAVSVASEANPPDFLRRKYWFVEMSRTKNYHLDEALGIDSPLRHRLPNLHNDVVVVGKWYCPFVFVKEVGNVTLKEQMEMSTFYEVTLEKRWDKVFGVENLKGDRKGEVLIDVVVEREEAFVRGKKAIREEIGSENGEVIWFKSCEGEGVVRMGLNTKIMERMKWEQEQVGLVDGSEKQKVRVERREVFEGSSTGWTKFGCYVLVERFVFKRMDKSTLLAYDFKHTHQIKSIWE